MYSRNYQKERNPAEETEITPPFGYRGVRFSSDRKKSGTVRTVQQNKIMNSSVKTDSVRNQEIQPKNTDGLNNTDTAENRLFSNLHSDDVLIIGLILFLAEEKGTENRDIILILTALLCVR